MKLTLVVLAALSIACAGNPKPKAVNAYQAVEIALGALQDAERAAFQSGAIPALTETLHRQTISPAFSKAFAAQIEFGLALQRWQPEQSPLPDGYDAWLAAIDGAAKAVAVVSPKNAALADAAFTWASTVMRTIAVLKQSPPPAVSALVAGGVQ